MNTTKEDEKIRVISRGGPEGNISLTGFSQESLDKMVAACTSGVYFIQVKDGKLVAIPTLEDLPKPAEDKKMLPFWRKPAEIIYPEVYDEFEHSKEKGFSPSITIQHLCGYNYTKEGYTAEAKKLESYGFECLRSRRGPDAKYWEIWLLPGLWGAKGEFKKNVECGKSDEDKLKIALEFLRHKTSFGTLDVSSQRLAMASPD